MVNTSADYIRVCHVNCQSLLAHFDEFRHFFANSGYHVICLSETWLKPAISDHAIALQGYHLYRHDRIGKTGGGVAFFLSNQLNAKILKHSTDNAHHMPEYLIAEISVDKHSKILLAVVYRPPHCGFLTEFFNCFSDLSTLYKHSLILGDFNADLCSNSFDAAQILSFVDSMHLFLVPYDPTHHTRTSSTWLDLCILDDRDKLVDFRQHDVCFLSAHDLINVTYKIKIDRQQKRQIYVRDFRSFDDEAFLQDLQGRDWELLYRTKDIESKVTILNNYLLDCYNKYAPLRYISPNHLPAPWLTTDIKDKMAERNRARKIWRRRRTDSNYTRYKELRNRVQNLVRDAKIKYYSDVFSAPEEPCTIWKKLRNLGLIKSKSLDSRLLFSTNELNDFFVGGTLIQNNFNGSEIYLGDEIYDDSKFYWNHIEPAQVTKALMSNKSDTEGIDCLTSKLIIKALPCILPVITHIFNFSLLNGSYPEIWKTAIICPLPKVKHPSYLSDYRPISILCSVSKAFERIVADQIKLYLEVNDLFDPCQAAYRRGFSTQTALIKVLDDVRQAADLRKITVAIFFDFTKAFDNVRHHILIEKLRHLGFSSSVLRWLCAYLVYRQQTVRDPVSRERSSFMTTTAGVPQGSVLGPLLFVLYLTNFNKILHYCKYNFYADDLLIYLHVEPKNLADAVRMINTDISNVADWSSENGLSLNSKKTKAMIMGTTRYINSLHSCALPRITVNGVTIPYSDSVEYLGVTISNTLSWEKQISKTTSRVFAAVHQLKMCKHLFPVSLRIRLVLSLILPLLDYSCTAFTDITKEQNLRLQRAFNACIRFIYQVKWDEHISPYYDVLRWLKIHSRRLYFVGNLTFSILRSKRPLILYEGFELKSSKSVRMTRALNDTLVLPKCRTECYKRSFRSSAAELWNSLPSDLRNASSLHVFKSKMYDHLFKSNH